MHPIVTVRSWVHHVHMLHLHRMAEAANRLFYDAAFWALVALITLFVTVFILMLNAPTGVGLIETTRMYPFPIIL